MTPHAFLENSDKIAVINLVIYLQLAIKYNRTTYYYQRLIVFANIH